MQYLLTNLRQYDERTTVSYVCGRRREDLHTTKHSDRKMDAQAAIQFLFINCRKFDIFYQARGN